MIEFYFKIREYFKFAFENFKHRRLRSWLTMLGIFIGIAMVVSLISLGQGLQSEINAQFEAMGIDKVMVIPGENLFAALGTQVAELNDDDLKVIEKVPGVKLAGGFDYKIDRVEFKKEIKYTWLIGIPLGDVQKIISDMQQFNVGQGRDFKNGDRHKVLITSMIEKGKVFDRKVGLGDKIQIGEYDFEVIGIIDPLGNPQDDSSIYLPLGTAVDDLGWDEKYATIMAQTISEKDVGKVAELIKKRLRKSRDVEKNEEDFVVQTSEDLQETYATVLLIVQVVIIGIALISLFVGGIGIMNTMYTAVLQRTKEIGIMKAVGATNKDITMLFLIESGLLGLGGGVIGIIIGIIFSEIVSFITIRALDVTYFQASFPPALIIGALLFSFITGALSGLTPAIKAASQKPVDALRYE